MTVTEHEQQAYIDAQASQARVNVEFESEGMTLNIGPQHPATHGTLRIVVKLDGEQVILLVITMIARDQRYAGCVHQRLGLTL